MAHEQFEEIIKKLDLIAKLISLNLIKDERTVAGKVRILDASGFKPKEIATLLDKKLNNIHQVLHKLGKKKKSAKKGENRNEQGR